MPQSLKPFILSFLMFCFYAFHSSQIFIYLLISYYYDLIGSCRQDLAFLLLSHWWLLLILGVSVLTYITFRKSKCLYILFPSGHAMVF